MNKQNAATTDVVEIQPYEILKTNSLLENLFFCGKSEVAFKANVLLNFNASFVEV